ncbi:MAG: polysulfide reductase NrfD [bacterium]|nr:MAG: polysulfide reductase NrfD [bacterium]
MVNLVRHFFIALKEIFSGTRNYYIWIGFLGFLMLIGWGTYLMQLKNGLIVTAMRDQVSWGFYLSNFTFLVGVAAAAVLLVIPAYIYDFKPIKEIVLFGEMLAITAISMCIMFIMVDVGRPERVWHLLPFLGTMNFPASLLAWDVLVLNGYLAINLTVVFYVLYRIAHNKEYSMAVVRPLVILSIPWAVSIHTVTAFLYNGLPARPFWNASILAPRFLASAFCSGPALMLILFQIIRKVWPVDIEDRAINKIAELIAYAMGFNLFLFGAEVFKEFYSGTIHMAPLQYMYFGLHGHSNLVPYLWTALIFNLIAFFLFLSPRARENPVTLNMACVLVIFGVYIEKGMGLVIPGFIPGTLGEIYEYSPTNPEILITIGVWATGALIYTLMLKFAVPVYTGRLRFTDEGVRRSEAIPQEHGVYPGSVSASD